MGKVLRPEVLQPTSQPVIEKIPVLTDISATLQERGSRYGQFTTHASITQAIKSVMRGTDNWNRLQPDQQESLEMIAHKVGRILNGDPNYHDSWHDIVGYTKLVADRLATGKSQ